MQGHKLKNVQGFNYLGSTIQSDGGSNKEVANRIQAGWNAWRKIIAILCDRKVPVVRPAMMYGVETVAVTKCRKVR